MYCKDQGVEQIAEKSQVESVEAGTVVVVAAGTAVAIVVVAVWATGLVAVAEWATVLIVAAAIAAGSAAVAA